MLYSYQKSLIDQNPSSWLLAWGTGTGKSRTALELGIKKASKALIICPKALVKNWARETQKCVSEVQPEETQNYTILTKEEFRRDWNKLPFFSVVIIDEAHHFAGFRNMRDMSMMHKSLMWYFKKHGTPHRYMLTATPYLSTPMNIFALSRLLGKNWNYMRFKTHFFYNVIMGRRIVSMMRPGLERDLKELINQLGNTVALDDVYDVPEQTFETVFFDMTESQKKAIKELQESNYITRWTKVHQIENGTVKGDEYTSPTYFECLKNDYIASVCEENAKVAVFCRYTLQISMLKDYLENKLKKPVYVIEGATQDRDGIVQMIEKSSDCVVLINAACSEGYELPSIGVVLYASLDFSLKNYIQSQGRFLRANALKKNVFIHLISGEVDRAVYDSMMRKEEFHIDLFAKSKEK